jgi:hypothetical protein
MKIYFTLLVAFFTPLVHSIEPKEIVTYEAPCYNTKSLFESLKITHKETPIVVGKADDIAKSTMSLWIRPIENTWTIVATKGDLSCIIGSGTDFKLVLLPKLTNL